MWGDFTRGFQGSHCASFAYILSQCGFLCPGAQRGGFYNMWMTCSEKLSWIETYGHTEANADKRYKEKEVIVIITGHSFKTTQMYVFGILQSKTIMSQNVFQNKSGKRYEPKTEI